MASERAVRDLDSAFKNHGFSGTPPGLAHILRRFTLKESETEDQGRRRFYRRVFGILWFGNKVGEGEFRGKALPTYVYPECLKQAIRDVLGIGIRDYEDPQTSAVYTVTVADLFHAKWPSQR